MLTITLTHEGAARTARRVVQKCCLEAAVGPDCRDTAVLLTSEIVTNALLHGEGNVLLGVAADDTVVRVEVGDDNSRRPVLSDRDDDAEGGRGIVIVAALASAWGVSDREIGKTVWFELAAQP